MPGPRAISAGSEGRGQEPKARGSGDRGQRSDKRKRPIREPSLAIILATGHWPLATAPGPGTTGPARLPHVAAVDPLAGRRLLRALPGARGLHGLGRAEGRRAVPGPD